VLLAGAVLLALLLAGGSSRAMLASARLSCFYLCKMFYVPVPCYILMTMMILRPIGFTIQLRTDSLASIAVGHWETCSPDFASG